MNGLEMLLSRCYALGAEFTPTPDGKLKVRAPSPLPDELRTELRRCKADILELLHQQSAFLAKHLSQSAQDAFPDWQGLLIKSAVLDMSVWIVRTRLEGEELARETGYPALLLDDVLGQKGQTPAEARVAPLPLLIMGTLQ
jgi:hypothetical protein